MVFHGNAFVKETGIGLGETGGAIRRDRHNFMFILGQNERRN